MSRLTKLFAIERTGNAKFGAAHPSVPMAISPGEVLIDGNRCPQLPYPARAIVKGDASEPAISAASILAKTARDEAMRVLDAEWPQYGLAAHKGYPTAAHLAALEAHGVRDFYLRSFGPVKRLLSGGAGR